MNVVVEDIAVCRKALKIEVPENEVSAVRDEVTKEFVQFAQIPGFRAGKAPRSLIENRFAKQIDEEVERKVVPESYRKAIEEKKLRPVAIMDIDKIEIKKGQPLAFRVTVDVAPDFELPAYKGLKVKKAEADASDEEVDKTLENLRDQQADYRDVQGRALQAGDFAVVNYVGSIDGKSIKEIAPSSYMFSENKDMWMRVEEDFFLKGFTTQLIGLNIGDKKGVKASFSAEFPQKDLAGKDAVYQVELVGIKEKALPELNDEFAGKILPGKTLAELKEFIKTDLGKQKKINADNQSKDELVKQLLELVKLELPESALEDEKRRSIYEIVQSNQMRGVSNEELDSKKNEILENATKNATERLKATFILLRIAELEQIKPEENEVSNYLAMMADRYRTPLNKFVKKLRDNNRLQEVYDNIVIGKTLDFLLQNATVE